nr:MAG TPA: hypothetical protein [Caudoviricetes sp.]
MKILKFESIREGTYPPIFIFMKHHAIGTDS